MNKQESKTAISPDRLCSEVQLFDLCARERCSCKKGRFCKDPDMLARFEKIAEEDDLSATLLYVEDEGGEGDEYDDTDGYDLDEPEDAGDFDLNGQGDEDR